MMAINANKLFFGCLFACFSLIVNGQQISSFTDSYVTNLTPWEVTESSASMPDANFPAFIGSGTLGVAVDAAGLQSLSDKLSSKYHLYASPFQVTQSDLYVLHEGLISEHLYQDEIALTGKDVAPGEFCYGQRRNFMPLGYFQQEFRIGDKVYKNDDVIQVARNWKRVWNLKQGVVKNSFTIGWNMAFETEVFTPNGGETVFIKLVRPANKWKRSDKGKDTKVSWTINIPFQTRHGLPLYDEDGATKAGKYTVVSNISKASRYKPAEDYTILYGAGASGMEVTVSEKGITAVSHEVSIEEQQICFLKLDFRRFTNETPEVVKLQQVGLEVDCRNFNGEVYQKAMEAHLLDFERFWSNTASVSVESPDEMEVKRQFLMHMSEYLFRCGNNFSYGGTLQYLMFHQNGWGASNFHDMQYIVHGMALSNMWQQAEDNLRWMHRVMRPEGRAFPWMMTYDGSPTVTPERDRAPMSDANRAMLSARIYELAGKGRDSLLSKYVYPIVKRVANLGLNDWFYEQDGNLLFKGIETDVMGDNAVLNDAANVAAYITLIKKAIEYSKLLNLDAKLRQSWAEKLNKIYIDTLDCRYKPNLNATAANKGDLWFSNIFYTAEAGKFLDENIFKRTRDFGQQVVDINIPWIGFAAASTEIRLNRPDRAEQFFTDILHNRVYGPGYFEEVAPVGRAGLPPYASAHGSHLVASCEQIVLSDFWKHQVSIGVGMTAKIRMSNVSFSNLRARDGLIVSGYSTPKSLSVNLHHTGDPVEMTLLLKIPCEAGQFFKVLLNGKEKDYTFHGEEIEMKIKLEYNQKMEIRIEG
jgi:hypothetical protein